MPKKKKVSNSNLKHKSVLVTTTSQRYNFLSLSFAVNQALENDSQQDKEEGDDQVKNNQAIAEEESESQMSGESLQKKKKSNQKVDLASRKSVIV